MIRECVVCGTSFEPVRKSQKYCSHKCQHYARKHDVEERQEDETAPILRTYTCVRCGKPINIRSNADRRIKFCSKHCEKLYWKHSRKQTPEKVHREFTCENCGKHVVIDEPKDLRRRFCCRKCSVHYFSHARLAEVKAAREAGEEYEPPKDERSARRKEPRKTMQREFDCKECGKHVVTTGENDTRRVFCSKECSLQFYAEKNKNRRAAKVL